MLIGAPGTCILLKSYTDSSDGGAWWLCEERAGWLRQAASKVSVPGSEALARPPSQVVMGGGVLDLRGV